MLIWQFEMQRRAGRIDRDNAARAEELIRLRDEFVATVSHELRTPLTSIVGYLELIGDDESGDRTPEQQAFLEIVQRNAERLVSLVSDLLLVAEARDRKLRLDIREVELGELASECVAAAKPAADAKDLRLTLSRRSAPDVSRATGSALAQVMDNLISNAIKFTPTGGSVAVKTATRDGYAIFEVSDSGAGISRSRPGAAVQPVLSQPVRFGASDPGNRARTDDHEGDRRGPSRLDQRRERARDRHDIRRGAPDSADAVDAVVRGGRAGELELDERAGDLGRGHAGAADELVGRRGQQVEQAVVDRPRRLLEPERREHVGRRRERRRAELQEAVRARPRARSRSRPGPRRPPSPPRARGRR